MREPVRVLAGPTASGKTALGVRLAERHDLEIVSVDSRQLYRGMAVGSAAPTAEEQRRVPHHLVACVDPSLIMTAGEFGRRARRVIDAIEARGRGVLLVGGSGLYLRAVLGGLDENLPKDPAVRRRLQREAEERGPEYLHARLAAVDPSSAEQVMPRDTLRLVRALELVELTGRPASRLRTTGGRPTVQAVVAVLTLAPELLEGRIRRRVQAMIEQGLEEEVRALLDRGLTPEQPALKSVGYAETIAYLRGEFTREDWVERMVVTTRRYAKRQRTWFRSTPGAVPVAVDPENPERSIGPVEAVLGLGPDVT